MHRADAFLDDKIARARAAVEAREQHRSPDGRMARERQLARGREDAQAGAVGRIGRRQHEHGLGVIELARNGLHRGGVERVGVEHDRERIAGEAALREHVEGGIAIFHDASAALTWAACA